MRCSKFSFSVSSRTFKARHPEGKDWTPASPRVSCTRAMFPGVLKAKRSQCYQQTILPQSNACGIARRCPPCPPRRCVAQTQGQPLPENHHAASIHCYPSECCPCWPCLWCRLTYIVCIEEKSGSGTQLWRHGTTPSHIRLRGWNVRESVASNFICSLLVLFHRRAPIGRDRATSFFVHVALGANTTPSIGDANMLACTVKLCVAQGPPHTHTEHSHAATGLVLKFRDQGSYRSFLNQVESLVSEGFQNWCVTVATFQNWCVVAATTNFSKGSSAMMNASSLLCSRGLKGFKFTVISSCWSVELGSCCWSKFRLLCPYNPSFASELRRFWYVASGSAAHAHASRPLHVSQTEPRRAGIRSRLRVATREAALSTGSYPSNTSDVRCCIIKRSAVQLAPRHACPKGNLISHKPPLAPTQDYHQTVLLAVHVLLDLLGDAALVHVLLCVMNSSTSAR